MAELTPKQRLARIRDNTHNLTTAKIQGVTASAVEAGKEHLSDLLWLVTYSQSLRESLAECVPYVERFGDNQDARFSQTQWAKTLLGNDNEAE